jgi:hypothetical protein
MVGPGPEGGLTHRRERVKETLRRGPEGEEEGREEEERKGQGVSRT